MNALTRTAARTLIEAHPCRTLVVRFRKRTTGQMRRMACVFYPDEAEATRFRFDPAAKGLLPVWDVEKGARRFINLDGVTSVKASGHRLSFTERRAPDRQPVKRHDGAGSEPAPSKKPAPEKEKPKQGRPWEDLEQAEREMKHLFDTFTI